MSDKKYALIVAGGSGSRMGSMAPKQFMEINGNPLWMYTFEAFVQYDAHCEFILVLPKSQMETWKNLCKEHSFQINHQIVAGGSTRFHSVKNGLSHIQEEGIVFIHDGVRPLVTQQTIENCYKTAGEKGNALPVFAPPESIRQVSGEKNMAVSRERFYLVQTPQTFRVSLIKKAYQKRYARKFTDDASVLESTGTTINLVEGNRENIKITWPADLKIAAALLKK
ncbi:MAG: 2-C-methyl-D-erythritol 4-phosphate cytidylyltransferase [Prolixibacteraceae bacterium]